MSLCHYATICDDIATRQTAEKQSESHELNEYGVIFLEGLKKVTKISVEGNDRPL
jgi:hypothetical protein